MSKFVEVHVKNIWYKNDKGEYEYPPTTSYDDPQANLINVDNINSIKTQEYRTIVYSSASAFEVVEDYETLAGLLEAVGVGRNEQ